MNASVTVHHQLPESTETHVHCVSDTIQPSHPLSSPSPPALNLSQHQSLFKWVSSPHQVAKVLEFKVLLIHVFYSWTKFFKSACILIPCNKMLSNSTRNGLKKYIFFSINMWVCNDGKMLMTFYTLNSWLFLLLNGKVFPIQINKLLPNNTLWVCFFFLSEIFILYNPHQSHLIFLLLSDYG